MKMTIYVVVFRLGGGEGRVCKCLIEAPDIEAAKGRYKKLYKHLAEEIFITEASGMEKQRCEAEGAEVRKWGVEY